ncbi:Hypothetical predicted protein [Paramuricea clavata]|uniref:Uncharacterized protein n=1 Tax=Paramuricea clavata TaxID=317549 RepID=A0A6S7IL16_PARCT|nr:Hypothetical predicted protein [Paramuricea clavata]
MGQEKPLHQEEKLMLEFIMDNPVLWNVKMTDYRQKDKIWEEQADSLKGSLCDTHTCLDKKKRLDSAPNMTEREQWILSKFAFLKTVNHHRPEPIQSFNRLDVTIPICPKSSLLIYSSETVLLHELFVVVSDLFMAVGG